MEEIKILTDRIHGMINSAKFCDTINEERNLMLESFLKRAIAQAQLDLLKELKENGYITKYHYVILNLKYKNLQREE